ncbi:MAG: 30S ribosomal protein S6 [Candidatus Binataceae bacterium]|nr:30S ribosomal protein S6 [Candidatus Binataceae bacterium]
MRRYETIFILRPDLGEPAHKEAIKRFEGIVASNGGDLVETEEWGFRELAYNIQGERRGFYVRFDYGGAGATMNEVERNLKLADGVLRYLSVLVDDSADMAQVRTDVEARHRRAAEAKAAAEARMAAMAAERAAAAELAATNAAARAVAQEAAAAAKAAAEADAARVETAGAPAGEAAAENVAAPSSDPSTEPESGQQG